MSSKLLLLPNEREPHTHGIACLAPTTVRRLVPQCLCVSYGYFREQLPADVQADAGEVFMHLIGFIDNDSNIGKVMIA